MKIAITTPTGHVAGAVADFLLDRGDVRVKLLGRRPNKLEKFVRRGAEMAIGSQDDPVYLVGATGDVDALLWVTPPGYGSDDVRALQNRFGQAAAIAIRTNQIPRVVNLSSIGAQWETGVGPVSGLHDIEELLDDVATNITHLRPGFFMENLLGQLDSLRNWGRIVMPIAGSRRYPMVATRDIGRVAAERLVDQSWTGHSIRELHGPDDMSFYERAQVLSDVLGREITYVHCDPNQMRQTLLESGMSEDRADLMLELYAAIESERMMPIQPRSAETTTPTTLAAFAHEVLLPLLAEPVAH
jgi:uncharacterized protein YbjT (DUF2867 family)